MSEDLSHDPHLRAALRHAPDHALAPPAGVSQTILNAARQVHRPARPAATAAPAVRVTVAPPRALAWLRQCFASPRLTGGLATGLVAALGLGLWIDLGREPVLDHAALESARPARSSTVTPATAPAAEPSGAAANETRETQPAAAATPAALPPAEPPSEQRAARAAAKIERGRDETSASRRAPAAQPAPQRREDRLLRPTEDALAKSAPHAEPTPAAAPPATAPAAEVATAPPTPAPQEMQRAHQRDPAATGESRAPLAGGRAAALGAARAPAADSAAEAVASPAFSLLRRARGEVANGQARWTWMPPGKAAIVPLDDAAQAWLARVVQASRARWTDTTDSAGSGDALEVRWWRDDWPQATLRIEADGLRWIEHNGRIRHAALDPAALQRLRSP